MSLFTGMSDTAVGERGDLREEGDGEAGHVVSSGHDGDDTGGGGQSVQQELTDVAFPTLVRVAVLYLDGVDCQAASLT